MRPKGQIRVIGGAWRSRRLVVPPVEWVRPTPIRLRQTLYDWLSDWIVGRSVLDAFAGSGALGIEALSRGAKEVVFVDQDKDVCKILGGNLRVLRAEKFKIFCEDALGYFPRISSKYDLILLDPPFSSNLLSRSLDLVFSCNVAAPNSRIYVESPKGQWLPNDQGAWHVVRKKTAGAVEAFLLQRGSRGTPIR